MGFRVNAYATVWNVVNKGKFSEVEMSVSKKNTETGKYDNEFASKFVRFIGQAHQKAAALSKGDRIMITECDVTNKYVAEQKKEYVNFSVFNFEPQSRNNSKPAFEGTPTVKEEDLPF